MEDRKPAVYLDHNATTPVAPEVLAAMVPFLTDFWGNPSSAYWFGHQLVEHLESARQKVAAMIGAEAREVVFTSCGTESINSVLGSAAQALTGRKHIVTTAVEHSATLKYCQFLEKQGCPVTYLPVDHRGMLDPAAVAGAIRGDTALVSLIWANNETGMLLPVQEISTVCREKQVPLHVDAVQAAGKLPINVRELGVDFLSLSAHKIYAPKGIGALFVKRRTKFQPYFLGGAQEMGRRAGTENVAGIIAFGRAAELGMAGLAERARQMAGLRDMLEQGLLASIPGTLLNGAAEPRLPNTTNLAFENVEAEGILLLLDQAGICASSGSACTTGSLEPSHVLVAMGCSASRARSSIRFSLGRTTTEADVRHVLRELPPIIEKLRAVSIS